MSTETGMTDGEVDNEEPDEKVARQVVAHFVAAGWLRPQDAERARRQLAEGKLSESDWRLLAENGLQEWDDD